MEKIAEDLLESKLKQKSLGKACQSVHALASSLIMSSVQWEDLDDHLESTRTSIEARFRELELREEDIGAWAADVGKREFEFNSKADELRGLESLLGQKLKEVNTCKNRLHSLQSLITEHSHEVLLQEKRLETVEEFVREKERECELIESKVKEKTRKLNWVEKSVEEKSKLAESKLVQLNEIQKELELREELVKAAQRSIKKCDKELILKEERLSSVQKSLAECSITLELNERRVKEIEVKEKDFGVVKKSLEEWSCELGSKERELGVKEDKVGELRKSVEEGEKNLDIMSKELEERTKELALKWKEFDSIRKSTEERLQNLKSKERQLEDRAKELELKQASIKSSAQVETKILKHRENKLEEQSESLKAKEGQLEDQAKELELKQKEFESVKQSTEQQIQILKANERQLEVQAKELELKHKEIESMKQLLEEQAQYLKSKENSSILHGQLKIEQPEHISSSYSSPSNQCRTNWDGRGLQLFMNKHLKSIDSASIEITAHFQASTDPAKLVLDAMQGFYPSDVTVDNMDCDFDLGIIRRSCIVLLETLKRVSPQINPQVREEAIKLAGDWKAKMKTEPDNWLEVLGFLRLVTIFDITSAYDAKELQSLIATVGENEQATELSQAVGSTEMESTSIVCSPVTTEKPESSPAKDAATASQNLQLTATTDSRNFQEFVDVLSRGNELVQKGAGYIQNLIETKHLFEAVRLICTLKLVDAIPPVPLLKKFVEDLKERYRPIHSKVKSKSLELDEREKVFDLEIASLRDVIQCIKDCNLDSEYPVSNIGARIAELERMKEAWRRDAASRVKPYQKDSLASNVDQQQQQKSVASMVKQHAPPKAIASNVQQPEKIKSPPSKVVQQQEQSKDLVPKVEQELNMVENGKKRRWNQQSVPEPHQSKIKRTSESTARTYASPTHPPRPGAAPNECGVGYNSSNARQFTYAGMRAPYNYAAGAIPSPRMRHSYPQCMPSAPR